jgi:lipopolysaccharide/colanic/teichoic acid biosynthesis glycosyltransferase
MMKRLLDLMVAVGASLVCAPAIVICAVAVKLTSPGPALFRQQRLGLHGRPFTLLKLRTMYEDCADLRNPDGSTYAGPSDRRLTAVGRVLRETSPGRTAAVVQHPARRNEPGRTAARSGGSASSLH